MPALAAADPGRGGRGGGDRPPRQTGRAAGAGGATNRAGDARPDADRTNLHAQSPASISASVTIRADRPGPTIYRNVYGHFAEHLGRGVYEGIWVGEDSPIPNTRGVRDDVVAALKKLRVPVVRWPGGCFAEEYRWRDGVGPPRSAR